MMTIEIKINGNVIHTIDVTNRGPTDGKYADGDGPGGGGSREYFWSDGHYSGRVTHWRSEGALALTEKVCRNVRSRL